MHVLIYATVYYPLNEMKTHTIWTKRKRIQFERNENAYNLHEMKTHTICVIKQNIVSRWLGYNCIAVHFSFFIKLGNNLTQEMRSAPTVSSFKRSLIIYVNLLKPPSYYSYGRRMLNVLHTRLRHRCGNLNSDFFSRVNLIRIKVRLWYWLHR